MAKKLENFDVFDIKPCVSNPANIRFVAQADIRLDEAIPHLFLSFPPSQTKYLQKQNTLTLKIWNRMITLFPSGKIGITNTAGMEEAKEILEKLRQQINIAFEKDERQGPPKAEEIAALQNLSPMRIHSLLPKTNCGECGEATCMAFAFKILAGERTLKQCLPLNDPDTPKFHQKLQEELETPALRVLGWNS
ncbi:MAG: (Fe-S)-binding protein [Candidatus Hodarchaeota archaeon]